MSCYTIKVSLTKHRTYLTKVLWMGTNICVNQYHYLYVCCMGVYTMYVQLLIGYMTKSLTGIYPEYCYYIFVCNISQLLIRIFFICNFPHQCLPLTFLLWLFTNLLFSWYISEDETILKYIDYCVYDTFHTCCCYYTYIYIWKEPHYKKFRRDWRKVSYSWVSYRVCIGMF